MGEMGGGGFVNVCVTLSNITGVKWASEMKKISKTITDYSQSIFCLDSEQEHQHLRKAIIDSTWVLKPLSLEFLVGD